MKQIYIVRKFIQIEGGSRHYYEEEVFSDHMRALKFVKLISDEEDNFFLSELVTCKLDNEDVDNEKEVQIFDYKGCLLYQSFQSDGNYRTSKFFSIGDIVKLSPFPWNQHSPTHVETIGVVSKTPAADEDEYIVDYIRDGFIGHWHSTASALEEFSGRIPANLIFLAELADHYKGVKLIPEKTLSAVYNCEVFIEKVEHYNFKLQVEQEDDRQTLDQG